MSCAAFTPASAIGRRAGRNPGRWGLRSSGTQAKFIPASAPDAHRSVVGAAPTGVRGWNRMRLTPMADECLEEDKATSSCGAEPATIASAAGGAQSRVELVAILKKPDNGARWHGDPGNLG